MAEMPSQTVAARIAELATDIEQRKAHIATLEREAANARLLLASSQAAFVALMNG